MRNSAFDPHRFISDIGAVSRTDGVQPDPEKGIGRECYAFSNEERAAHDLAELRIRHILHGCVEEVDYTIERDPLGSQFVTFFGRNERLSPFMVHSHLDSVQNGGMYDGVAGIAVALGVLEDAVRNRPLRGLRIGIYVSEESSPRNGYGCLGSAVATGSTTAGKLDTIQYDKVAKLSSCFDPERWERIKASVSRPRIHTGNTVGSLEVHIEQSCVIAGNGAEVGIVVDGIGGAARRTIEAEYTPQELPESGTFAMCVVECFGQADHTGGTPPNPACFADDVPYRKDALVAMGHVITDLLRCEGVHLVSTLPRIESGFTAVPSHQVAYLAVALSSITTVQLHLALLTRVCEEMHRVRITGEISGVCRGVKIVPLRHARRYVNIARVVNAIATRSFWREEAQFGTTRATVTDLRIASGEVSFKLDTREVNGRDGERLFERLKQKTHTIPGIRHVKVVSEKRSQPVEPYLVDELRKIVSRLGVPFVEMPSLPGHDSDRHAAVGIPVCMLFIRQNDGISHSPYERMAQGHFDTAYTVAREFVSRMLSR